MSECPEYYRTSDGRELWEFYRDVCHPVIEEYCLLNYSQCHALESACEYIFRAGIKDNNPEVDIRKAFRLIDRIVSMETASDSRKQAESIVAEVVGKVVLERCRKLLVKDNQADTIRTAWGTVNHG